VKPRGRRHVDLLRRWQMLMVLACLASASAVGVSGAAFTSTSATTVQASTSGLASDSMSIVAGSGLTAVVGTAVATAPTVLVTDGSGNPVSGVTVVFTVTSGGGSVGSEVVVTGQDGTASPGSWTLGTVAGANTLTVTAGGLAGPPLTFTATGVSGAPGRMAMNAGNGQTATVGTAVATTPRVLVTDAYDNPVPGVAVTFAVASGGGAVTGAAATTDASGIAAAGSWTLGTTPGANTLRATSPGLTGSPVTFSATGVVGAAARYVVTSSSYAPVAGTAVAVSAQLADQYGNLVATPGIRVTWSRTGTGGSFSATSTTTNASGIAAVTFTTSTVSGRTYRITATSTSPSTRTGTSPAITTVPGPATQVTLNAGNNQTTAAGTAVATAPSVRVRDVNNNPVAGVAVTFAVASGGGAVTGAAATTNASGIAAAGSWTLGTTPGANTLRATSPGLTGSPVTFSATGIVGAAARYVVTSSSYAPVAGTAVAVSAQLADQYGNPVATSGIAVTFTRTGAGGSFSGANPATTNASGIATVTFTTGTTAGTAYTITATSTNPSTRTGTSPAITTR
jgi:adhesin/invasin